MKKITLSLLFALSILCMQAQDTTNVAVEKTNIITITDDIDKTDVNLFNDHIAVSASNSGDTTNIRFKKRVIKIIEVGNTTTIDVTKDDSIKVHHRHCEKKEKPFNGHWAGFELGVNGFFDTDYSLYNQAGNQLPTDVPSEFMELRQAASLEVNLNLVEWNISLKEQRIGIVSGLGFQWNNYKFDNPVTIDKLENGIIFPSNIEENDYKKSKLTVSYLTVPLLLEFQIPANNGIDKVYLAGGVVGGLNLGSHTKIKNDNTKTKDRGSFDINPFKCSAIARVGLEDFSFYATYGLTTLFKDNKGPELYPFTIGICLSNF